MAEERTKVFWAKALLVVVACGLAILSDLEHGGATCSLALLGLTILGFAFPLRKGKPRLRALWLLSLVVGILTCVVGLTTSAYIFGVNRAKAIELVDAVNDFRYRNGRLPSDLDELEQRPSVFFERRGVISHRRPLDYAISSDDMDFTVTIRCFDLGAVVYSSTRRPMAVIFCPWE